MQQIYAEVTAKEAKKLDQGELIVTQTSDKGNISAIDLKSLLMTLSFVAFSAVITYLLQYLPSIKLDGEFAPLVMSVVIMLLKLAQKLLTERKYVV